MTLTESASDPVSGDIQFMCNKVKDDSVIYMNNKDKKYRQIDEIIGTT